MSDACFLYPVVILMARYSGVYEGAPWIAFNDYAFKVEEAQADDVTCALFFGGYPKPIGRGSTPQEAYEDLRRQVHERN